MRKKKIDEAPLLNEEAVLAEEMPAEEADNSGSKKKKRRKQKYKKEKRTGMKLMSIFIPLVLAFSLFFGLLSYMEVRLKGYDNISKVVLIKDIPAKTHLTNANVGEFFVVKEIKQDADIKGSVDNLEALLGTIVKQPLLAGTVMSLEYTDAEDSYLATIANPTEISFTVKDAYRVLCGYVRKGDKIDIDVLYDIDDDGMKDVIRVKDSAYVHESYTTENIKIEGSDMTSLATSFTIILDESEIENFKKELSNGEVYVSLVQP